MADKSLIVNDPDMNLDQKAMALLLCVAQERKSLMDKALAGSGLSLLQLNLLHALSKSPEGTLTVNELKSSIVEENPNVSRTLNKMVEAGWIRKTRSEEDQRTVFVSITAKGEAIHVDSDLKLGTLKSTLSKKDQKALVDLLQKL